MIEVMAAATAAERLGSVVMAAVTTSVRDGFPPCIGSTVGSLGRMYRGCPRSGGPADRGMENGARRCWLR